MQKMKYRLPRPSLLHTVIFFFFFFCTINIFKVATLNWPVVLLSEKKQRHNKIKKTIAKTKAIHIDKCL